MIKKLIYIYVIGIAAASCNQQEQLQSPDGHIRVFLHAEGDRLFYHTVYDGDTIIDVSALGLLTEDMNDSRALHAELADYREVQDSLLLRGRRYAEHYRYYRYEITRGASSRDIEFKIFNDAIAYRYLARQKGRVHGELSSWKIPPGSDVWYFERPNHWKLKSYAGLWMKAPADSLEAISPTGPVQGDPLVIEHPDGYYITLTEAALYHYSGMRLEAVGNRTVRVNFTEPEGFEVDRPVVTPWRVTLITRGLNELVTSTTIESLNPRPDPELFGDAAWIRPGRSVWSWWSRDSAYMTIKNEKKYIDYASKLGFEYALLDEGWEKWPEKWETLTEMIRYAGEREVAVWVWKHSKEIMEVAAMNSWLDSVAQTGAAGVKVDFMNGESKDLIDFDIRFLQACAERKLMVNFHGCQAPSGESRTYPNEMTREGVRGIELNIMGQPLPAWHNAALPFTRYVVGHGDYTPLAFSRPGNTTWTRQLATAYLFDSPFMSMAEDPAFIFGHEELQKIVPLLRTMPVVWDKTIVLPQSRIGKLAGYARRKGDIWYVIFINGEDSEKSFSISPDFLTADLDYQALTVSDNGREAFKMREFSVSRDAQIDVRLESNGGFLVRLTPSDF